MAEIGLVMNCCSWLVRNTTVCTFCDAIVFCICSKISVIRKSSHSLQIFKRAKKK